MHCLCFCLTQEKGLTPFNFFLCEAAIRIGADPLPDVAVRLACHAVPGVTRTIKMSSLHSLDFKMSSSP